MNLPKWKLHLIYSKGSHQNNYVFIYQSIMLFLFSANAAKEDLLPYFPQIIEHLKHFLTPTDNEDLLKLQLEAIGE